MTASLLEVAQVMATKLSAAVATSPLDVQVEPFRVLQPTPPCIDIYPGDPYTRLGMFTDEQAASFGGDDSETIWTVRARIGTADNEAGQEFLLRLMDTQDALSVVAALQADQTLNGKASSVYVQGSNGHTIYEDTSQTGAWLGVAWKVTVIR